MGSAGSGRLVGRRRLADGRLRADECRPLGCGQGPTGQFLVGLALSSLSVVVRERRG
jgi:hypothetical protein